MLKYMKTLEQIKEEYKVENNIIKSPGKFEGEPVYTVYYWDLYLDGGYDELTEDYILYELNEDDYFLFTELTDYSKLYLYELDNGFVISEVVK